MNQNQKQQSYQPKPLPTKKSIDDAIRVIEALRDMARHQMELGYWATVDFPSKHHINRVLQLSWRNRADLVSAYGEGLTRHIYEIIPICKAYVQFLRDPIEDNRGRETVNNGQKVENKSQ
jgi:hypothetical protein